jgi:hypothetical protein
MRGNTRRQPPRTASTRAAERHFDVRRVVNAYSLPPPPEIWAKSTPSSVTLAAFIRNSTLCGGHRMADETCHRGA